LKTSYPIVSVDQLTNIISLLTTLSTDLKVLTECVTGESAIAVKNNTLHPALNVVVEALTRESEDVVSEDSLEVIFTEDKVDLLGTNPKPESYLRSWFGKGSN
jgi:hypothetical protein